MKRTSRGFTIVELLIVIVVVGVLAALVVAAFNGVQNRAKEAGIKTSLTQSKRKLELYKADANSYPNTGNLSAAGIENSNGTTYQYTGNGTTFCMTASNGGVSYNMNETSTVASGACSGQLNGGILTNLVTNPSFESNTASWSALGSATISQNCTERYSGSCSLAINVPANAPAGAGAALTTMAGPVDSNSPYASSVYIKSSADLQFHVDVYNGSTLASPTSLNRIASSGWNRAALSPSPVSGQSLQMAVKTVSSSATALTFYIDAAFIAKPSQLYQYADGNSPGWTWAGPSNNSTSSGPPV